MKEDQRKEACESHQQIEERLVDRVLGAYEKMNMTEFLDADPRLKPIS